jgi:hypothetical protein
MSQAYDIDSFGNMGVGSGTLLSGVTFDTTNEVPHNRIDVSVNGGSYMAKAAAIFLSSP